MERHFVSMPVWIAVTAACAAGVFAAPADAPSTSIGVFADHYVLAGRSFDDLDQLERQVQHVGRRFVALNVCAPGATRALEAAAHRLRDASLQLRVVDATNAACTSSAPGPRTVEARGGQRPLNINDDDVARYWRELLP